MKDSTQSMVFHLGLTGFPLGHSLSPRLHRAALDACHLEGEYSLFPVPPAGLAGLAALLDRLRDGSLDGLNVTIPHKPAVLPLLDELTPAARAIGAVNTVYRQSRPPGCRLIGDNTDAPGFLTDLSNFLSATGVTGDSDPRCALVLGAGGAARAIVYALQSDGWDVTLAARRLSQAQDLARDLSGDPHRPPIAFTTLDSLFSTLAFSSFTLLVNTTPAGMSPDVDASPWPEDLPFPPRAAVYDLVYNPAETRLVRQARRTGLPATGGLGMLIEQAALSFERWTGYRVPRPVLMEAVR